MKTDIRKGLINGLSATGQNFGADDYYYYIAKNDCSDGASSYTIDAEPELVVPPIPKTATISVKWKDTAAEVRRMWTIGHDGDNVETITAGQRYTVAIQQMDIKYEGANQSQKPMKYSYTAPSPLSGTAAARRSQVYTALKNKINNDSRNNTTAYLCSIITGTADADITSVEVGDKLNNNGGTWEGYVAYVDSDWEEDASIRILVYSETAGDWSDGDVVINKSDSDKEVIDASSVRTTGQGLMILDDAGYYWSPSLLSRGGASNVWAMNFDTSTFEMARDATYAHGVGSVMAKFTPSYDIHKKDVISGDILMDVEGDDIDTSKTYTLAIIDIEYAAEVGGASQSAKLSRFTYYVYADDNANLAAFKTALNTME